MDGMHRKMESVIQQLLARRAKLIILCNAGDAAMDQFEGRGCSLIRVPRTVDALQPVVNIVPLQLLSYHLTTIRCARRSAAAGAARARGWGEGSRARQ
jgi:glucosamine--fructose-6-phosphate aminotransferase (isomerizing)